MHINKHIYFVNDHRLFKMPEIGRVKENKHLADGSDVVKTV